MTGMGHNNPPDPIDQITAPFDDAREEAVNWLDGSKVTTEAEMLAVDALRADMRKWRLGLEAGSKDATAPLHRAWQDEAARWKPVITDAKRIEAGLVALTDDFKRRLAAEKEAARKAAEAEAWAKTRAAQEAARTADASNLEAQRAANAAAEEAKEAQRKAAEAAQDRVKGLRTVTRYEVTDHRALLNWIAKTHRDDITAFIDEWARKHHKTAQGADGLRVWQEKEGF